MVHKLLVTATSLADFVVVDTPAQFTEHVLTSLDISDAHLLVATPDIAALKNLRVTLDMLDMLNLPEAKRLVVLNRSDAKVGLSRADIERVIQVPTSALVPSSRDVPMSINRGTPIVLDKPNHRVSKAVLTLAGKKIAAAAAGESAISALARPPRPGTSRFGRPRAPGHRPGQPMSLADRLANAGADTAADAGPAAGFSGRGTQ